MLQEHNFDLVCIKGSKNSLVDGLSRLPDEEAMVEFTIPFLSIEIDELPSYQLLDKDCNNMKASLSSESKYVLRDNIFIAILLVFFFPSFLKF